MEKRKGIIYVYFNRAKYEKEKIEKYYVGQTVYTMEQRAGKHGEGYGALDENCNTKFANSIKKWGWEAFEGIVLEEVYEEDLNELEMFYIEQFDSYKNGYNCTLGGEGVRGLNPYAKKNEEEMKEIKQKISEKTSGENNPMYGKSCTDFMEEDAIKKMKQKMSKSRKGKNKGINNPMYGKRSPKAKQVYCNELNILFDTMEQAKLYCKNKFRVVCNHISGVCRGYGNSSGKLTDGTKLTWKYVEDVDPDILKNAIICDYEE